MTDMKPAHDRTGACYMGRGRNAAATRQAILDAARQCFGDESYDQVGVRDIAAIAGIDPALVNRYFGSKEALFAEVIGSKCNLDELVKGDRAGLGERLARKMVSGCDDEGENARDLTPLLLLLRSATEDRAADLLRAHFDQKNLKILADVIGGPDAATRAALVISQIIGFATMHSLIKTEALTGAERDRLQAILKANLDACILV